MNFDCQFLFDEDESGKSVTTKFFNFYIVFAYKISARFEIFFLVN